MQFANISPVARCDGASCAVHPHHGATRKGLAVDQIKKIMMQLADVRPYRPAESLQLQRLRKLSTVMLALGSVFLAASGVLLTMYRLVAPLPAFRFAGLLSGLLTELLAVLALLVEPFGMIRILLRWRTHTLESFIHEIEHDRKHVSALMHHDQTDLEEAQRWLQVKVKRLDSRVMFIFGGGAAAYSLLGLTLTNMKDAGGLVWAEQTVFRGFRPDDLGNTLLLWAIVFVLGLSLGALLSRAVQRRYTYQLELVEMTLARKTAHAESVADRTVA